MNTKTTIADVYRFAFSANCPIGLGEAIIHTIDKLFYSLDIKVQKEIKDFKGTLKEELNND